MLKRITSRLSKQKYLFIMLVPGFLLTLIFAYAPLFGWSIAFTDYDVGMSLWDSSWVGLKHFKDFFTDSENALYVFRNTIVINIVTLFINIGGACLFAILLNEMRGKRFKKLVQTVSLFPFFISWAITYIVFNTFLSSTSGLLNKLLVDMNVVSKGINFLGDPKYSWGVIWGVGAWKFIGYNAIIFLASIANIDQAQYEAAEIDGAGRFAKVWYITLPGLLSTAVILIIMNSGWIFSSNFEEFYLFSNPTNWKSMEVFDVYIYNYGLKLLNFPYATAVCIVKTFASILMLLAVNGVAKKLSGHGLV